MSTHKHAHFLLTRIRRNEIFESETGYIDIRTRKVCRNRSEHPHPVCGRCVWWIYSTNSAEDYLDSQDTFSWRRDRERREWLTAAAPVEPRAARRGGRAGGRRRPADVVRASRSTQATTYQLHPINKIRVWIRRQRPLTSYPYRPDRPTTDRPADGRASSLCSLNTLGEMITLWVMACCSAKDQEVACSLFSISHGQRLYTAGRTAPPLLWECSIQHVVDQTLVTAGK